MQTESEDDRGRPKIYPHIPHIFKVMTSNKDTNKFLYPHHSYHGKVKPENLVFNSNLQEFAQKISYICNLETGGKVPPEKAYKQIKSLWKELKRSKKELGIGQKG